ncbi:uncharacterized protein [Leptinotarsa decemlineata]|uniref:uncharacterized protein n=1 Tax=Leptinotarsa decemlineata TaxID=7539 RepID=UPI003D305635
MSLQKCTFDKSLQWSKMLRRIINYKKLKNENESECEEIGESETNSKSGTLNKKQLENVGIIVGKRNAIVSGSAIKLLLNNMVTPEDITNILTTNNDLKTNYCKREKECEFCNKKCNICKVCCMNKEMQMYLVNYAMQKLSFITFNRHKSITCQALSEDTKPTMKNISDMTTNQSDSSETLARQETFKKLKRRLKNVKKYYPEVYSFKGNIIEKWGENSVLKTMKQDILDLDVKSTSLFWV